MHLPFANFSRVVDKGRLLLLTLSVLNLLVMHYTIISTCDVDKALVPIDFVDNILIVLLEVLMLSLLGTLVLRGHQRQAALLTFVITWLWALCNILYSRFFGQYIPLSAFSEGDNLMDAEMLSIVLGGFQWSDLYFLLVLLVGILCFRLNAYKPKVNSLKSALRTLGVMAAIVVFDFFMHFAMNPTFSPKAYLDTLHSELFVEWRYTCQPLYTNFQRGSMRNLAFAWLERHKPVESLTQEQQRQMMDEIEALQPQQQSDAKVTPGIRNVVFLLVESYMSFAVDREENGQLVMPFLHALAHDSTVYYNPHMTSNITIGESSDGQFIYLTGLLPLRSEITASVVKKQSLIGLPSLFAAQRGMQTRMVVPTSASFWSQDVLCQRYGVNKLYSRSDYHRPHDSFLNDEQIFQMADSIDGLRPETPFFSIVLTYSMHMPYPEQLKSYLDACRYTDQQIAWYFDRLKKRGLFDNSLIIIVADHQVEKRQLQLPVDIAERELPLFIVNGGIKQEASWHGQCHQLDVYTTLLDFFDLKGDWRGLGHTLLKPDYMNSLTPRKWDLSEQIIYSNWLGSTVNLSAGQDADGVSVPSPR